MIFYTVANTSFDAESGENILFKLNKDDKIPEIIFRSPIMYFEADENWIYLALETDNGNNKILRTDHNGNKVNLETGTEYSLGKIHLFDVSEYSVFFSNLDDNGYIYKMDHESSDMVKLMEDTPYSLKESGGYLYYFIKDGENYSIISGYPYTNNRMIWPITIASASLPFLSLG